MTHRILAILTAVLLGGAAHADTLDLGSLPAGNLGTTVSVSGATLESIGNSTIRNTSDRYFQNAGGSVCAQKGSGSNCQGAMNIKFNGAVKKLNFYSAGYKSGDSATIVLYHNHQVVGTSGFSWNGRVDLTAWVNVTRIKIEYVGFGDGMAIGKFNFVRKGANHGNGSNTGAKPNAVAATFSAPVPKPAKANAHGNNGGGNRSTGGAAWSQ